MANDNMFYLVFALCSEKHQYVFQVSDMFGSENKLTIEELEYWLCYNIVERAKFSEVDYNALPMEEVILLVEQAERKRKAKYEKGPIG